MKDAVNPNSEYPQQLTPLNRILFAAFLPILLLLMWGMGRDTLGRWAVLGGLTAVAIGIVAGLLYRVLPWVTVALWVAGIAEMATSLLALLPVSGIFRHQASLDRMATFRYASTMFIAVLWGCALLTAMALGLSFVGRPFFPFWWRNDWRA